MEQITYERAISIKNELKEISQLEKWLNNPETNLFINNGGSLTSILLDSDMRNALYNEVVRKRRKLELEFEQL